MSKTIPSQDLRNERLAADPTCSRCGITKTVADFPKVGVDYWCLECRNAYARRAYHKRRERLSPDALAALRGEVNQRQNSRRAEKLAAMTPDETAEYREKVNRDNAARRYRVRDAVYQAYGGYKCSCCGETERAFLSIDHINNDGSVHKREHRLHTGEQLYRWIARNGFPKTFQVLCMNCQWGKRNSNGICPHQAAGKV